jgi:hypothetical protein
MCRRARQWPSDIAFVYLVRLPVTRRFVARESHQETSHGGQQA